MYIPPATVWITISGQVVHDLCFKQSEEGSQFLHRDGSSPEIWVKVTQRFAELAKQTDIDDRCRGLAREAAKRWSGLSRRARCECHSVFQYDNVVWILIQLLCGN